MEWSTGLIHGKADSGFDLQYRGGLKYDDHPWKTKNLYLNGLMFMMEGKVTRRRLGHPAIHPAITGKAIVRRFQRTASRSGEEHDLDEDAVPETPHKGRDDDEARLPTSRGNLQSRRVY